MRNQALLAKLHGLFPCRNHLLDRGDVLQLNQVTFPELHPANLQKYNSPAVRFQLLWR